MNTEPLMSKMRFFDAEGRSLQAIFTEPNRYAKLLGPIESVEQGVFTLGPTPDPETSEFRTHVLADAAYLHPNRWFASLEALRERFSKHSG